MKKLYTIVWLLMMSLVLSAAEISLEQALGNARSFMLQKSGDKLGKKRVQGRMNMQAVPTGMPELYAFNIEGGGYVIASADDRTLPVLGYSLTGRFDASQMPDNMRSWLQGYAEQIRMLGNVSATSAAVADLGLTAIEPLIQTHWGQEAPYNLQAPVVNGLQTVTGCVATAMAQVMYYHQWPKAVTTDIPAYTYTDEETKETVEVQGLPATTFEWDKMLPTYTKESPGTEEQQQAVARLMRYCGQTVRMDYGESSGAHLELAANALRNYFDYSKSIRLAYRYYYSLSGWCKLIWGELNQKRPVLMGGWDNKNGHAFIIDGYDGSGMFHVNWGWDGTGDEYYVLDVMAPKFPPSLDPPTPDPDGFAQNQRVVLGVEPSTGSEEVFPEITRYIRIVEEPDTYYETFTTTVLYFDTDDKLGNFDFAIGTKDTDGNISIKYVQPDKSHIYPSNTSVLTFHIECLELPDGSYKLYPFYRDLDVADDTWHQIGNDHQYWGMNVNGSEKTYFFDQKLKITNAYLEGDEQAPLDLCTLVVEVENYGENVAYLPVSTLLYGQPNNKKYDVINNPDYSKGELELQHKEKTTLRYPFAIPLKGDIELRLCRAATGSILATTTLTIDKEPHYYDIEVTDYRVVYKADEKDMRKAVKCTLSIKNNDKRPLSAEIYTRIGDVGRENGGNAATLSAFLELLPGESDEIEPYLGNDLKDIKEPTDLHLEVMMYYNNFVSTKLLDLNIKPGTTVTSKGTTTSISTIEAPDADAPLYDLQGRRVSHPQKGIYIHDGRKVVIK